MSRWFRFYECALDDPKVQRLPGELFKVWVNLLCLTARCGGTLPPVDELAFALRMDEPDAMKALDELIRAGLLDRDIDGHLTPHNWKSRQYQSDCSTQRVQKFRKQKAETKRNVSRNVAETAGETPPDTDTDTEQIQTSESKLSSGRARERAHRLPANFEPSETDIAFARKEGLTDDVITRETDKFRDYWLSQPGSRGTKLDWHAAFRNWIRKAADDLGRSRPTGSVGHGREAPSMLRAYQRVAARYRDQNDFSE